MKRFVGLGLMFWPILPWFALASAPTTTGLNFDPNLNLSVNCPSGRPSWMSSTVPSPIDAAVIVSIPLKTQAQQSLSQTELNRGEVIDPADANDQRVILQWRVASGRFARAPASVPEGMVVYIGEEVAFTPFHGDPDDFCFFVPNLIER